ncbi:UPF0182 family protein [Phaeacidiphilus oryzae]|uniref:UPF0182 family protein n=1 Tax=Phaeacidiphilus oryzae TaxID=348818 RepID=UPI00068A3353|nr:UPF0182 family protein [Phaeacidiphilus oryzae]
MVFQMPPADDGRGARPLRARIRSRRTALLLVAVAGTVLAAAGLALAAAVCWTDWLWYRAIGYGSVLTTRMTAQAALFAAFGGFAAALVGVNVLVAYRVRPPLPAMCGEQLGLQRVRTGLAGRRGGTLLGVCLLTGGLAGWIAAAQWRTCLAWLHSTPFGARDPQFHLDASFYTFELPWYRFTVAFGVAALLVSLLAALLVHYLYGAVRTQGPGARIDRCAQYHLGALIGAVLAVKAVGYWLDRYGLAVRASALKAAPGWTGLRWTDANGMLPAKTLLCCAAAACALLLILGTPLGRSWTPGLTGVAVLALTGLLTAGVYPMMLDGSGTRATDTARELPYVQRNITATREAFGLTGLSTATASTRPAAAGYSAALRSIQLLDPTLAADAYGVSAGVDQGALLAVRAPGGGSGSWTDRHLRDTYGTGLLRLSQDSGGAATATAVPGDYQRRVYYSATGAADYAVTGSAAGPGRTGVAMGDPLSRAAYAVRLADPRLLLSGAVGAGSRLLYDRSPQQRVAAAAPWLTVDSAPYPALVGGRIEWVVDGYTTATDYPDATRSALGGTGRAVDYVRDAVKATVDAYTGEVTLYQWDSSDPVLRTWMKAFPGTVRPRSAIPAGLLPQLRYPTDLFAAQRTVLARYHVTDPAVFLSGSQVWKPVSTPAYAAVQGGAVQGGGTGAAAEKAGGDTGGQVGGQSGGYALAAGFAGPDGRVTACLTAGSTPGPDYGALRLLQLPADSAPAPVPAGTDTAAPAGDGITYGRELILPYDGALLEIRPAYAARVDDRGLRLRSVRVDYGSRTAVAGDLPDALRQVLERAP